MTDLRRDTPDALQRYTLKVFAEPATALSPRAIIPVFHQWIQEGAVDGLLIDVADYTHLPNGPSALLVGHEGNYAIDGGNGRPGLSYSRKRQSDGTLTERLTSGGRTLLKAACLLETNAASLPNRGFTFRGNEIAFRANDRLVAPNTSETASALRDALHLFGSRIFGGSPIELIPGNDGDHVGFTIRTADAAPLEQLLDNLR